jgi:hypothetical protein
MDAKAVKRYGRPGYPTRLQVLARPQLLEKSIPVAWRQNASMAGAVALLLAANGCTQHASTPTYIAQSGPAKTIQEPNKPRIATKAVFVAPIFEHGEGRGATGCIAVAPPVFLSEEEALQVIIERLKQSDVNITKTNTTLSEVAVEQDFKPVSEYREEPLPSGGVRVIPVYPERLRGTVKPLKVDGQAADRKIAFDFISRSDYYNFAGARSMSSVQDYDFKSIAEAFARRVAENDKDVYFGTFYDPMVVPDVGVRPGADGQKSIEERESEAKELAKSLLRQQVVDFVNWLKAQGAI